MIDFIELKNFQSHKESRLEFAPGVNAIIGPSDAGKSAILRGLFWAVFNDPSGIEYRSNWGGDTSVTIGVDNQTITRLRSASKNWYIVNEAAPLKAVDVTVPEEIQKIFNMSEINKQEQLDSPFLLKIPPGQVAGHFNKIAHLQDIDNSTQLIKKWTMDLAHDIRALEMQITEQTQDLLKYDNLDEIGEEVEKAEWLEQTIQRTNQKISKLTKLVETVYAIKHNLKKYVPLLEISKQIDDALLLINDIAYHKINIEKLQHTLSQNRINEKKLQKAEKRTLAGKDIDAAIKIHSELQKHVSEKQVIESQVNEIKRITQKIKTISTTIIKQQHEFDQAMPDICPLCGQEVK